MNRGYSSGDESVAIHDLTPPPEGPAPARCDLWIATDPSDPEGSVLGLLDIATWNRT